MKKIKVVMICATLSIMLSSCSNTIADKNNMTSSNSVDNSYKRESDIDNFLKTITEENAEYKGLCEDDLTYYYKDNVLIIKGTGEMSDYSLYEDGAIPPWNEISNEINLVIVDDGVTSIGSNAFSNNEAITKVFLPLSLTSINDSSFERCLNLQIVDLQEGLTAIGDNAFNECYKLGEINLPTTLVSIGRYAFNNCESLEGVILPERLESIGDNAFANCVLIENITIPKNITRIEDFTFYGCNLKTVVLNDNLEYIGHYGIDIYTKGPITFPSTLKEINGELLLLDVNEITFLGDAPEMDFIEEDRIVEGKTIYGSVFGMPTGSTIYYNGDGFEDYIEYTNNGEYTYNWVKNN